MVARTVWACHPVSFCICSIVPPDVDRSRAISWDCLVERGGVALTDSVCLAAVLPLAVATDFAAVEGLDLVGFGTAAVFAPGRTLGAVLEAD